MVRTCLWVLLNTGLLLPQSRAGALDGLAAGETDSACLRQTPQASVVDLLEVMGVFEKARAQTHAMVEQLRRDNPKVPEAFWANFSARVADRETLISLYAPVYLRHLSQEDVCALVRFYRTRIGAHYLHAGPEMQKATRDAAQARASTIVVELLGSAGESGSPKGLPSAQSPSQIDPEDARTAAIHELLRRSGDLAAAQRMMGTTLDRLRQAPQQIELPPTFWDDVRNRLLNEDDLLRLWMPAYAREFTDEEIRGLLDFYRSPVGVRYVAALPSIEAESLAAGGQLGHDAAKRAVREVYGPLPQWRMLHPPAPVSSK